MAGKPQNRIELRRQYEAAEPPDPIEDEADEIFEEVDDDEEERRPKRKAKATKAKAKATKSAKPAARMRVVWVVVNDAFKPIATFEFSQKEAAYAKAAELTAKNKGTHFVQRLKEPMPENAPGLGAAILRDVPAAAPKPVLKAADLEEDEELETEEEVAPEEDFEEDEE